MPKRRKYQIIRERFLSYKKKKKKKPDLESKTSPKNVQ
jgi:hypothetical protein